MDQPYSKRELDFRFDELFKRMDKQDVLLERIETQTTKTNGRVNLLEAENTLLKTSLTGLQKTRDQVIKWGGGLALAAFIVGLLPFLFMLYKDIRKPPEEPTVTVSLLTEALKQALAEQATVIKN